MGRAQVVPQKSHPQNGDTITIAIESYAQQASAAGRESIGLGAGA